MGRFDRKYSDAQREAMTSAMLDKGTPAKRVQQLARAGELDNLEPFDPPLSTINTYAQHERKRRRGKLVEGLANGPIKDANEELIRRLIQVADRELTWMVGQAPHKVDPNRIDRMAAALGRMQPLIDKLTPQLPPDERPERGKRPANQRKEPEGLLNDLQRAQRRDNRGKPKHPEPSTNGRTPDLVANYGSLSHRTTQPTPDTTSDFLSNEGVGNQASGTQTRAELAAELAQHPAIQRGSDA